MTRSRSRTATERLYLKEQRPTALIVGSSGQHSRTLGEALRKGLVRVPKEVSLVCFDQNFAEYGLFLGMRPTVVALPLVDIGRTLARLAREAHGAKTRGEKLPAALTLLPCALMEGDSVAAFRRK